MKVVVTGGAGKVGSEVVRELAENGHQVTAFDQANPSSPRAGVRWVRGDTLDFGQMVSLLRGAEAVVHLAAIPLPGTVVDHVLFRTNLLGTYNVHEAAFQVGVERVVCASSTAILGWAYRTREIVPSYLPVDEQHPTAPQDAYATSKLCEEQIAQSYTRRCDMETVMLRLGRILVPEVSAQLRQQGGSPTTRFDVFSYVDVRDAATAFRKAVEVPIIGHEYAHIVADDSTVGEPLCTLLPRLMPEIGDMASALTGEKSGIANQYAKQLLGWKARHTWRTES